MSVVTLTNVFLDETKGQWMLQYVNANGKPVTKGVFAKKQDGTPNKLGLVAETLKAGDTVEIKWEKNGQWFNIVGINKTDGTMPATTKAAASPAPKPWTPKKTGYDSLGQQIGNCITNSIASLGPGKTMLEYQTRAAELISLGDSLRAMVEKGETLPTASNLNQADNEATLAAASHDINDDDNPF